jgi:hypothetical protein
MHRGFFFHPLLFVEKVTNSLPSKGSVVSTVTVQSFQSLPVARSTGPARLPPFVFFVSVAAGPDM